MKYLQIKNPLFIKNRQMFTSKISSNTLAIVNSCVGNSAANTCASYNSGINSDWFLPSLKELDMMWKLEKFEYNFGRWNEYCFFHLIKIVFDLNQTQIFDLCLKTILISIFYL